MYWIVVMTEYSTQLGGSYKTIQEAWAAKREILSKRVNIRVMVVQEVNRPPIGE